VFARFVVQLGVVDWRGAVQLGVWLWFGFVFMILVGAVVWDNVPWKLTAIHAGDWLVKLPLMAVILSVWRGSEGPARGAEHKDVRPSHIHKITPFLWFDHQGRRRDEGLQKGLRTSAVLWV